MKKVLTSMVLAVLAAMFMTGCCLKHEWADATCKEPKTCVKCGKTMGDTLEHEWEDATCAHPKTCSLCGKEKGDTLPHTWMPADCENPETCSECGATQGVAYGHDWEDATCTEPKTCWVCGKTEGSPKEHVWHVATIDSPKYCEECFVEEGTPIYFKEVVLSDYGYDPDKLIYAHDDKIFTFDFAPEYYNLKEFDLKGNMLYEINHDRINSSRTKTCAFRVTVEDEFIFEAYDTNAGEADDTVVLQFLSYEGKVLAKCTYAVGDPVYTADFYDGHSPILKVSGDPDFYEVYDDATGEIMGAYQVSAKKWIEGKDYVKPAPKNPEYKGSWHIGVYQEAINGFIVANEDMTVLGYVDKDDNLLGKWGSASVFTKDGLALVSEYGYYYDLIDADMNVVGSSCIYADSIVRVSDGCFAAKRGGKIVAVYFVKNVK